MKKKILIKNLIMIPTSISTMWNLGFMMSMFMVIQIMSGMMMSLYYTFNNPFYTIINMMMNMNYGWMMRTIHSNMCSMIMMIMILHMTRNIYFSSTKMKSMWMSGMAMLMTYMMISFMGYTLPWSQMSYWGMTVIMNTLSIMPMIGEKTKMLIWSNFNINLMSLNRMFIMHFIMPIMLMLMTTIHLMILHKNSSNNSMGTNKKMDLIPLNPYFLMKDLNSMMLTTMIMTNFMMIYPMKLNNKDNFIMMNNLMTPNSIEPEWYFLIFYSILRSIENKFNGLMLTIMSMMMIMLMPTINDQKMNNTKMYFMKKSTMWMTMNLTMLMSIMGSKNIESPFTEINKLSMITFFMMFPMMKINNLLMDKL